MSTPSPAAAAVAIFDSGLGGLSVARHIRARMPRESLLYFADCGWAPYGARTEQEILERVGVLAQWLAGQHIKAMVVACNTATTIAIAALRKRYPELPIVGVEPGVKPAVALSRSGVVGVLATQATLGTASFQALLARQGPGCRFVCQAGHGLVALIEAGGLETPAIDRLLQTYLDAMLAQGVDTLVLGSTHFPLLIPAIERHYGSQFALVHTGEAVAARLDALLAGHAAATDSSSADGPIRLVSSCPSEPLVRLATELLGTPLRLEIALDQPPPPDRH